MKKMIATGIVRRVDDLGRIVIPKEIRRSLGIREGDPLEIFRDRDGSVIFKKYDVSGGVEEWAQSIIKKWGDSVKGVHIDGINMTVLTPNGAFNASCSSNDKYNFSIGVAVALAKAYNEELPYNLEP